MDSFPWVIPSQNSHFKYYLFIVAILFCVFRYLDRILLWIFECNFLLKCFAWAQVKWVWEYNIFLKEKIVYLLKVLKNFPGLFIYVDLGERKIPWLFSDFSFFFGLFMFSVTDDVLYCCLIFTYSLFAFVVSRQLQNSLKTVHSSCLYWCRE